MSKYEHNQKAFKELLDKYTVADLESMIYQVPEKASGACCYPAIQTLISLMEMIGKLLRRSEGEIAIKNVLDEMGGKYQSTGNFEHVLYDLFRNGIAHNSLAKGGVFIRKSGADDGFHLSNNGKNIDVKIFFEDFKKTYENLFNTKLKLKRYQSYYETNLRKVLSELKVPWLDESAQSFLPGPITYTTISGVKSSGASGVRGSTDTHTP